MFGCLEAALAVFIFLLLKSLAHFFPFGPLNGAMLKLIPCLISTIGPTRPGVFTLLDDAVVSPSGVLGHDSSSLTSASSLVDDSACSGFGS